MRKNKEVEEDNAVVKAFVKCRDLLARSILKMSVSPEDVDDILQETFLRAYTANDKKEIRSPQDYLFVVSRNLVIRGVTNRSRELNAVINDALFDVEESSLDIELHEKLKLQTLSEALALIPARHRQAILLRKIYGLSSIEIAKKMGISKSSVDKYIASGIKKCAQILDARGYDVGNEYGGNLMMETPQEERSGDA